jgi:hypothetical protein
VAAMAAAMTMATAAAVTAAMAAAETKAAVAAATAAPPHRPSCHGSGMCNVRLLQSRWEEIVPQIVPRIVP